ncbi:MAG: hypothetical protein HQ526_07535 [Actinobacteria bacterium]|nr:hypothetical protein [Actinomycetota bacterium]
MIQHLEVTEATYYRWRNQGGFNRLSQHLVLEVFDGEKAASRGSCSVCEDAVAWAVGFPAAGEAGVLAADRARVSVG